MASENRLGKELKIYRNVFLRSSVVGDGTTLGDDVFVTDSQIGFKCTIERRGMVFNSTIGDYSYTGFNTIVKFANIGKFCSVSWNVSLGGANHDFSKLSTHPLAIKSKYGFVTESKSYESFSEPVYVGNDVWIGSNASILRNVRIGDGAVIGAGAVVTHDVGPYEIWAGVPARRIGQRFSENIIEKLESLRWWDLPYNIIRENIDLFTTCDINNVIDRLEAIKSAK